MGGLEIEYHTNIQDPGGGKQATRTSSEPGQACAAPSSVISKTNRPSEGGERRPRSSPQSFQLRLQKTKTHIFELGEPRNLRRSFSNDYEIVRRIGFETLSTLRKDKDMRGRL